MKTKNLMQILLAIVVGFTSCETGSDNTPDNIVEYNSSKYTISKGTFVDNGTSNYYGTHYDFDFYATDGTFIYNSAAEVIDVKAKIAIYAYMSSFGTSSFKTGTYTFIDDSNDSNLTAAQLKSKYENKSLFYEAGIVTGADMNTSLANVKQILVTSGAIKVEGTKPNYTLTYDLVLEGGKTVKGSYFGTFKEAY